MNIDQAPTLEQLKPRLNRLFDLAGPKIHKLAERWNPADGAPVFTVKGQYTTRGWTEWTQGFQFGCALLQFDAVGERTMLDLARRHIVDHMATHVSHIGVHDHGFNNVSTYGNLRRLIREDRVSGGDWQMRFCELSLKASGAVQAARWTRILDDEGTRTDGFVHSFNGPHSLFSDTIRSMRSLVLAWQLGHQLMAENDQRINLLERAVKHIRATARYNVYYGEGRDAYDTPDQAGRVVHESIFNTTDGRYRCPSTQQGYSPFSTWTRGLAWVLCGFAEQLEFFVNISPAKLEGIAEKEELVALLRRGAQATADWYIRHSFTDAMVYWDAGAPNLPCEPQYNQRASNPYDEPEPIDSSAAAIAAQGFFRLAKYFHMIGEAELSDRYDRACRAIAATLFDEPYLSTDPNHEGLILHSIYHRPNHWDHVPEGRAIPCGESSMWGDYHAMELALLLRRREAAQRPITFFDR